MNLETEIELVEGEDHSASEKNKQEKKEIELIEGMISALGNGIRCGGVASHNGMHVCEFIINIPTPPPELV